MSVVQVRGINPLAQSRSCQLAHYIHQKDTSVVGTFTHSPFPFVKREEISPFPGYRLLDTKSQFQRQLRCADRMALSIAATLKIL